MGRFIIIFSYMCQFSLVVLWQRVTYRGLFVFPQCSARLFAQTGVFLNYIIVQDCNEIGSLLQE